MLGLTCIFALILGLYPFVLYPFFAALVGRLLYKPIHRDKTYLPRVTIIPAAYNEARHIEATIRDKLAQDYPPNLIQMIVVSDESSDGTDEIVRSIHAEDERVTLLRQDPRQGKTAALNLAVPYAMGEIIVFADANSLYQPHAIRALVSNFADPQVGYVSGKMQYVNPDGSVIGDGCSAYMRYENWLRDTETRIGSIVGVDGGIDAVRAECYQPMRPDQLPDFVLPLCVVEKRLRVIYEPEAILREDALNTQASEYRMRVRVALRAFWALWDKRNLLNPIRYGIFSWQLASHKWLRYLAFIPLTVAALIDWALVGSGPVYQLMALGQLVFLALWIMAARGKREISGVPLPALCQYFALLNLASAVAFWEFINGRKRTLWQPRQG